MPGHFRNQFKGNWSWVILKAESRGSDREKKRDVDEEEVEGLRIQEGERLRIYEERLGIQEGVQDEEKERLVERLK